MEGRILDCCTFSLCQGAQPSQVSESEYVDHDVLTKGCCTISILSRPVTYTVTGLVSTEERDPDFSFFYVTLYKPFKTVGDTDLYFKFCNCEKSLEYALRGRYQRREGPVN